MRMPFNGKFGITMKFGEPAKWFKGGRHLGVDWALPKGTPLTACFSGIVSRIDRWTLTGYGRAVYIRSADSVFEALYAHLSEIECEIGESVHSGQVIGKSGHSGYVISLGGGGYHLHFGLKNNGVWVDPLKYIENEKQIKIPVKNLDPEPATDNQGYITTGYVVKRGDTLWSIAEQFYGYDEGKKWKKIFYANEELIANPKKIYPGQVLKIPGFK